MVEFKLTKKQYSRELLPELHTGQWILMRTPSQRNNNHFSFGRFVRYGSCLGPDGDDIFLTPTYAFKPRQWEEIPEIAIIDRGGDHYTLNHGFELWTTKQDIVGILEDTEGYETHVKVVKGIDFE